MKKILLYSIKLIHFLLVLFILAVPFVSKYNYFLIIHCVIVPFILLHWITNNNICFLTVVEKYLRGGNKEEECFTCKLINPVYDFSKNMGSYNIICYAIMIIVFLVSFSRLYLRWKNGEIKHILDIIDIGTKSIIEMNNKR